MLNRWLLLLLALPLITQVNTQTHEDSAITISLKAMGGLQYDQVRFRVKPGAKVRIILTNADEMSHNLVITQPGAREEVVNAVLQLGEAGPQMNYVPPSSKVLWYIPVLTPGQTASITFTAPDETGVYPYVCTYPGHGLVMYGAMYVTHEALPPMAEDPNIPPNRKGDATADTGSPMHEKHAGHPYDPVPPYLYRILVPDAGPAAIAVSLPQKLSYCWDAGACRLRYAWEGEFLDPTDYWAIKGEPFAKISGTIFYRDKTAYPLRVGEPGNIPTVAFKGYRLIQRYPEFHYTINGMDVYELILPKPDGTGLERTFRIPATDKTIWFAFDPGDGVHYTSSVGQWENDKLKLSAAEAQHFTITMTKEADTNL